MGNGEVFHKGAEHGAICPVWLQIADRPGALPDENSFTLCREGDGCRMVAFSEVKKEILDHIGSVR